ncbi:MAG: Flp pilus assembly complex ATPase component TadA, partial [Oscillospiraceae bacterium]|nr:Flp pilus assembly complex ATPase component TadA [Oscillospiraceae bacterium]
MALIKRKPASSTPAPTAAPVSDSGDMTEAAATQSYALMVPEVRTVNLDNVKISQSVLALIPESIAIANKMLPLHLTDRGTTLVVAMADSRNDDAINNIGVYTGLKLEALEAPADVILEKIRAHYTTQRAYAAAKELVSATETVETDNGSNDESVPIISFVNNMIEQAVLMKASDIHIEPHEDKLRIRFRIDGKMVVYMDTEADLGPSVSSRIKFISGLNIAERRIPQDGRI